MPGASELDERLLMGGDVKLEVAICQKFVGPFRSLGNVHILLFPVLCEVSSFRTTMQLAVWMPDLSVLCSRRRHPSISRLLTCRRFWLLKLDNQLTFGGIYVA